MSKNKLVKLVKYRDSITERMGSTVPDKHKNSPKEYFAFLSNELRLVSIKIDEIKLALGGK